MSKPTIQDCIDIQHHLRRVMLLGDEGSLRSANFIQTMFEMEHRRRHTQLVPPLPKEAPVAPRPVVTEHRVKKHVFSDGTIWESCTATGCDYCTSTGKDDRAQVKRHTDRAIGIYDGPEFEQEEEVEASSDDPSELSVDALVEQADALVITDEQEGIESENAPEVSDEGSDGDEEPDGDE